MSFLGHQAYEPVIFRRAGVMSVLTINVSNKTDVRRKNEICRRRTLKLVKIFLHKKNITCMVQDLHHRLLHAHVPD